jgi:histidinol-phosphate phosphatase family protein
VPIYLVTNQPAIAKGFITIAEVETSLIEIENLLASEGMFFDDIAYCPHHPESGFPGEIKELKIICSCRKPALGMFYGISAKHGINLSKSIYIGDSPTDREVAKKLDGTFILWKYLDESNNDLELLNAVELL